MQVIPVIDLLDGAVVRAVRGERANYRPIRTPLAEGSAPADVAAGLLRLYPFPTLYVADLDAIAGRAQNAGAIAALTHDTTALTLWLDAGASAMNGAQGVERVIGSESLAGDRPAPDLSSSEAILSLDFRGDAFLGPAALPETPALWPSRVIVMTLARVGSGEGPDFARLAAIQSRAGGRAVYAAGGVRNCADLERLADMGVAGALVASALHDGRIAAPDIARLATR